MRKNATENPNLERAFTRLELVMIVAILVLLAGVALPLLAGTRSRSEQVACFSNLRQAGHAFQVWANDHGDKNPWWTPIREGGSYNTPGDPAVPWLGIRNNAWFQWSWISNQLGTPKILVCPSDGIGATRRMMALNFSDAPYGGFLNANYKNSAVSYVVALHSVYDAPRSLLSGDRNIQFSSANSACSSGVGLSQTLNDPYGGPGWTNAIHGLRGNLLFTDGSVEQSSNPDFRRAVNFPGPDDNGSLHFVVPP